MIFHLFIGNSSILFVTLYCKAEGRAKRRESRRDGTHKPKAYEEKIEKVKNWKGEEKLKNWKIEKVKLIIRETNKLKN